MELKKREYAVAYHMNTFEDYSILDIDSKEWLLIDNPKFGWCADPFLYKYNDNYYIFAEMYMYSRGIGGIGYCKYLGDKFSEWKLIIKEPYHISYPNIFMHDGTIYICPESGSSEEIYLYRCIAFPDKWIKDTILFSGLNCADTTYNTFDTRQSYGITWRGVTEGLYFFKTTDGKIDIYNANLVTNDNTYARPAGNFCCENGIIYRPGQIGEPNYGAGLSIIKCSLNNNIYSERIVRKIYAKQFLFDKCPGQITGVHTYNRLDRCEVIDVQYNRFETISRIVRMAGRLNRKIRRCI